MGNRGDSEVMELRVLFVEDSVDDYELIVNNMVRAGLIVVSKRVETPEDFEYELTNEEWNLIISDNSLPRFNSQKALKITRSLRPEIPFIIVSGTIGEENAVKVMKMGADDFILKDNLSRLIPAIRREWADFQNQMEMQRTQRLLETSKEYYQLLAQNVQDLVCIHDNEGAYSWVSPSSEKLLGYTPEELIKMHPFSIIHPDDKYAVQEEIFRPMISGKSRSLKRYRCRRMRKDGVYMHFETLAEPIYVNGKLSRIVSTTRDITEQVLATYLLEENQAKYESVLECMSEGIVLLDRDKKVLSFNTSAKELLLMEDVNGKSFSNLVFDKFSIYDEENNKLKKDDFLWRKMLFNDQSQNNIIYRLKSEHDEKWFSFNRVPYVVQGKKEGYVISFLDITESYKSKDKLDLLAKELIYLIETANAPIFGIDTKGNVTEWNNFSMSITGYSKSEAIGKNFLKDLIFSNDQEKAATFIAEILSKNVSTNCELSLVTKKDRTVTLLMSGSVRRDFNGEIFGILCVCQDITELIDYRRHLEFKVEERTKELKLALEKQKELVQLKSKFVSMASHEFRTPLSTIKFACDFIKKYFGQIDQTKVNSKLDKIDQQISHMTYLLDDVLIIGKGESGKIKVEQQSIDLKLFCEELKLEIENHFERSHEIVFTLSSSQKFIVTDAKLLRNIFTNLLSNAIKFSPERDIVKFNVTNDNDLLTVVVEDKGMGIPIEEQTQVFDAFHRSVRVSGIQGTGLGLSITKRAVELLGGMIELTSEINKGTKFTIKIPTNREEDIVD